VNTLSVVIPVYRPERERLHATVASARETFPAAQIVMVDDGSGVEFDDLIESTAEYFAAYRLTCPVNVGPAGALNTGYARATGTHVARLDVGDVWKAKPKRQQLEVMAAHDVAASFTISISGETGREYPISHKWDRLLYRDNQFQASSTIVKRWVWERVPFDASLRYGDDWDWHMKVQHLVGWTYYPWAAGEATCWPGGHSTPTDEIKQRRRDSDLNVVINRGLALRYGKRGSA
jgi:glycosyltransferase involved in cell wall biosynthesis